MVAILAKALLDNSYNSPEPPKVIYFWIFCKAVLKRLTARLENLLTSYV